MGAAEQLEALPCGQTLRDKGYSRSREGLRPAPIKEGDHWCLILEIQGTPGANTLTGRSLGGQSILSTPPRPWS